MNEQRRMEGQPARILLATDLSARCDRAFDRAVQIAREWQAEIVVLTVLEEQKAPDEVYAWWVEIDDSRERFARRQLEQQVSGLGLPLDVQIREGDVADAIREVATTADCGLIVTGMARNETFGRFWIGSTVERLAQALPQPLLVARTRVRGPYGRILVATDFSASSRHALRVALQLFPDREFILFHAFGFLEIGDEGAIRRSIEEGECAEFLATSGLSAVERSRLKIVIERGSVEIALPRYVKGQEIDLAVLGTHGRSHLVNVLIGSSALELLKWLPCDTVLVRQPRAKA
jgi:nucleotide-binding universal stress UspA family protein